MDRPRRMIKVLNGDMLEALANGHTDFSQSFDARDWAREFVATVRANPSIATDESCMVGWFANAIMRGYDTRDEEIQAALV